MNKKVREKSGREKGIRKLNSCLLCGASEVTVILYQSQKKRHYVEELGGQPQLYLLAS